MYSSLNKPPNSLWTSAASNNSRIQPLSYVVWLSTSCEWQSPRHRNHSDPHLNILKVQIKWQAAEEKHTGPLGWVKTSRFTESSWRKTSFDVSIRLYLKNILMLCRGLETIHMLTGTRYMYEIVLTGKGRTRVGGASNWTEDCRHSHATRRYEHSLLETKVILILTFCWPCISVYLSQ